MYCMMYYYTASSNKRDREKDIAELKPTLLSKSFTFMQNERERQRE